MNLQIVLTIAKKELRSFFDNPTAYIVLTVFLLLWEFLFFRNVFLVGEASLRIFFDILPWLYLILVPALTMGSIAGEKSEGTLEFLLTHPVKDLDLILGKFLGVVGFVTVSLLVIFPIALSLSLFGNIDWGVVAGQAISSILLAGIFIALGIFVSSLLGSQISSLLVTVVACFFLVVAGFDLVTANLPLTVAPLFERLSVMSHYQSLSRGVIDVRDVWYFISATALFLSLAYLELMKRRFGNRKSLFRSFQKGVFLFSGIAILTNVVGSRIPGRLDLTQDRVYTLSSPTRKTLGALTDVVHITLYASSALPAQFQPILRDTKDLLRDYVTYGRGNITVVYKNPSEPQVAQEAGSLGVREIQFNVVGQEEFQVKTGYLGLAVAYAGKHETLPFIEDTRDLEYQLTSFLVKLTTKDKKKIAFLSGHGEKSLFAEYQALNSELEKQFETESVTPAGSESEIATGSAVLVIAGPTGKIEEKTRSAITTYLNQGNSAYFLLDPVTVSPQSFLATVNQDSFTDFLKDYGVSLNQDLVYDLRSHETVRLGTGLINYFLPYPLWARVVPVEKTSPITTKIESVVIPWGSSLTLDEAKIKEKGFTVTKLLTTTKFGGKQTGNFSISPDTKLPQENLGEQLMAVALEKDQAGNKTRLIAVTDSDFLTEEFIRNTPENLAFGISTLSYLAQAESLSGIKLKGGSMRKLLFQNQSQVALVKYGNLGLALVVPVVVGGYRVIRRRNLKQLTYQPQTTS